MPWEMDIAELKGTGFKEGETLLPDVTADIPAPQYDETVMSQLVKNILFKITLFYNFVS